MAMNKTSRQLIHTVNRSVINLRGLYSAWAKELGISYNELLVYYTLREYGFCTQKQVCDNYLLPRQTINHLIQTMHQNGLLAIDESLGKGKEKAFILTEKGQKKAAPVFASLDRVEDLAIQDMGAEKMKELVSLLTEHRDSLAKVLSSESKSDHCTNFTSQDIERRLPHADRCK